MKGSKENAGDGDQVKAKQPLAPTRSRVRQASSALHPKWTDEEDNLLKELASQQTPKWSEIAHQFPNKTAHQVSDRWVKVLNPNLLKGSWTGEEDQFIINWVNEHGPKNWGSLAENLPGRISKQCRERWHNHLCPSVLKTEWSREEDEILIECQGKWGNKWSKIAAILPGRTDNSVKNRWNSSLKRRIERLQSGQEIKFKRGRKPKRASEAPTGNDIPKPNFDETTIKNTDIEFSPIKLESSLNTPATPNKNWIISPAAGIFSPNLNWSGSQSPFVSWNNPMISPFPPAAEGAPSAVKEDLASIAPPKLD